MAIANAHVERYRATFEGLAKTLSGLPAERLHHSHFADFRGDALAVVRDLYTRFELPWSADVAAAMEPVLQRDAHAATSHRYSREVGSHSPAELQRAFAGYRERFSVPAEATPERS